MKISVGRNVFKMVIARTIVSSVMIAILVITNA